AYHAQHALATPAVVAATAPTRLNWTGQQAGGAVSFETAAVAAGALDEGVAGKARLTARGRRERIALDFRWWRLCVRTARVDVVGHHVDGGIAARVEVGVRPSFWQATARPGGQCGRG